MSPTPSTVECRHATIVRWSSPDGEVIAWACEDCRLRFYPACLVCVDSAHRSGIHVETRLTATDAKPVLASEPGEPK